MFGLERNDPAGAVKVFTRMVLDGTWRPEVSQMLIMMQDRPRRLLGLLEAALRRPDVKAAMKKIEAARKATNP